MPGPLCALHRQEAADGREGDYEFLENAFQKLLLNFTWWVNRKDASGRNVFQGGFLGLDNIGAFDRSSPLPMGGYLEQADGTAWMCFFAQTMLQMPCAYRGRWSLFTKWFSSLSATSLPLRQP